MEISPYMYLFILHLKFHIIINEEHQMIKDPSIVLNLLIFILQVLYFLCDAYQRHDLLGVILARLRIQNENSNDLQLQSAADCLLFMSLSSIVLPCNPANLRI